MTNVISIKSRRSDDETNASLRLGDESAEGVVEGPEIDEDDLYEIARNSGLSENSFLEDERFSGIRIHPEDQRDLEKVKIPRAEANNLQVILAGNGTIDGHFTDGKYEKVKTSSRYGFRDEFGTLDFSGSEIGHLDISETDVGELDLTNTSLAWSYDSSARDAYVETMKTGNLPGQETVLAATKWDLRGIEVDEWTGPLPATTDEECRIIVNREEETEYGEGLPESFDRAVEDPELEATRILHEGSDGYGRNTCVEYKLPRALNIQAYEQ